MPLLICIALVATSLFNTTVFAAQHNNTLPPPHEQQQLLANAIDNNAVYVETIEESGVFSGYIENDSGAHFPVELYLNGTVTFCLTQPPHAEFRVCIMHTFIEKIEGDKDETDPVNLTARDVLHVYLSGKTDITSRTLHYFKYEELLSLNVAGSLSDKEKKLARHVIESSIEAAEASLGSYDNIEHPAVPDDIIHITLVEALGPYHFKALVKSKTLSAELVTVHAEVINSSDAFVITFVDENVLPELYGSSYRYSPKFYSATFSGKQIYEVCHLDDKGAVVRCGEYWADPAQYFRDEAERDLFDYL